MYLALCHGSSLLQTLDPQKRSIVAANPSKNMLAWNQPRPSPQHVCRSREYPHDSVRWIHVTNSSPDCRRRIKGVASTNKVVCAGGINVLCVATGGTVAACEFSGLTMNLEVTTAPYEIGVGSTIDGASHGSNIRFRMALKMDRGKGSVLSCLVY